MSCRRGVPKNDCSCCKSLAEKVRELWERAANAIKTINGVQADGANNFDILPGAGIQVNPRANGIEIVATGAMPEDDGIKTINYVQPDEDGDFILRGGTGVDIEEIEDEEGINGLEISCTVEAPTYAAGDGIEIEDDTISLKDWYVYTQQDWSVFVTDDKVNEDVILVYMSNAPSDNNQGSAAIAYLPILKGTPTKHGNYTHSLPGVITYYNNEKTILMPYRRDIFTTGSTIYTEVAPLCTTQINAVGVSNGTRISIGESMGSTQITKVYSLTPVSSQPRVALMRRK